MTSSALDIERAAALLKEGKLVAFPTETVYGLGADASNSAALTSLYALKGRPTSHPVIVHIAAVAELEQWAKNIPADAYKLAEKFWPGPMTLILPKADHVLPQVTGGQDSIGLRLPSHPLALKLLALTGGLAAPSANRFGRLSPTSADAVRAEFAGDAGALGNIDSPLAMILDGGACQVGIESTIIAITDEAKILRPGMITSEAVEAALGYKLGHPDLLQAEPRVPGSLASHYAPQTRLTVTNGSDLVLLALELSALDKGVGVIASSATVEKLKENLSGRGYDSLIVAPADADQYARLLYEQLRRFDALKLDRIFVETVPSGSSWDGVRDRLQRASAESEDSELK